MTDLNYIASVAQSEEFGLWQWYDQIAKLYNGYNNSGSKSSRVQRLTELRRLVLGMQAKIQRILISRSVQTQDVRNINKKVFARLSSYYLNLTQLLQQFIHSEQPKVKTHYLTAMFYLLGEMAEVILATSTEPEPLLEQTGD